MMTQVLHHYDFASNPRIDSLLHRINQRPLWERLKLLNSHSRSNPYPRFLYKYRPLLIDNADHVNWLREYVVESRLWLSSPASFNDPFDMRGRHVFEGTPQAKRRLILSKLKKYRPELSQRERELQASNLLAGGALTSSLDSLHNQQRKKVAVCSFAGDARNILMWSHYGSNHTGVCLQFRVAQDIYVFSNAITVEYSSEYPIVDYLKEDYHKSILPTLFRKAKDWEYEHERRIVLPYGANSLLKYEPSALASLILGCQLSDAAELAIRKMLIERHEKGLPPVKVFRARRHDTKYNLQLVHHRDWLGSR